MLLRAACRISVPPRHHAGHVTLASIVDDQSLVILPNLEWNDQRPQLTRAQQILEAPRAAGVPARDDIEVLTRERLVHERATRTKQSRKQREHGAIEEADADDRVH